MKFQDLQFISVCSAFTTTRANVNFPNGYGASIIQGPYAYGGDKGFYELAVLKNEEICYDTDITSDVLGWLKPDDVDELLGQIEALPSV